MNDMAVTQMNSQQLWLVTQDQVSYKFQNGMGKDF